MKEADVNRELKCVPVGADGDGGGRRLAWELQKVNEEKQRLKVQKSGNWGY